MINESSTTDKPKTQKVMYTKVVFEFSEEILPRLQEVADQLEVPPFNLVHKAVFANHIDITPLLTAYLDEISD